MSAPDSTTVEQQEEHPRERRRRFETILRKILGCHHNDLRELLEEDPAYREALLNCESTTTGTTPLGTAAQAGDLKSIDILLEFGADIEQQNNAGFRPLYLAFSPEVVKHLLDKGAEVDAHNGAPSENFTALSGRGSGMNTACARFLIDAGADIEKKDGSSKWTALMWSASDGYGSLSKTKLLLQRGADIGVMDYYGQTVLSQSTRQPILDELLKCGADVTKRARNSLNGRSWLSVLPQTVMAESVVLQDLLLEEGRSADEMMLIRGGRMSSPLGGLAEGEETLAAVMMSRMTKDTFMLCPL